MPRERRVVSSGIPHTRTHAHTLHTQKGEKKINATSTHVLFLRLFFALGKAEAPLGATPHPALPSW